MVNSFWKYQLSVQMHWVIFIDREKGTVFGCKSEQFAQKSAITSSLQRITKQNWDIFAEHNYTIKWLFLICMNIKHLHNYNTVFVQ